MARSTSGPLADDAQPQVRADVVQAATRIFSRRGYHGTSMQHIADELGMRKASLYHHVKAKEDLLFAIHERLIDRLIDQTVEVVSSSRSPEDKLRHIILVNTRIVVEDVDALAVFLKERDVLDGERWASLVSKRDLYEHLVVGVLRDGIRTGAFIDMDPNLMAKVVLAMPGWLSMWYRPGGPLGADELADVFSSVAIHGVLRSGHSGLPADR